MFAEIKPSTPDPIMSLMETYLQDRNPRKVNLGIGLYYDERGKVPLMRAVEQAERRLLAQQPHGYPPIEGSASFASQIQTLLLGPAAPESALATVQTVGGSGALKLAADFLVHFLQRKEIWVSDPTWANHQAIFSGAGLQVNSYPYFDNLRGELRFADMLTVLQTLPAGTAVLLHPCCHNPTGTDLSQSQWQTLLGVVQAQGLLPFFDIAYQGFGAGLEEDCYALRLALASDLDFIVANSFSKNIALYGQRVGGLTVRCANAQTAANVQGALKTLIRRSYSCPPTHGSRIVDMVLADAQLRQLWQEELAAMRQRIQQLRQRYAIYLVAPGRMCLPGLNGDNIDYVTAAILDVTTAGR